jgi:hypothetical protein
LRSAVDAAAGDTELAVQSAREALAVDPPREGSLRHLMHTPAQTNRRSEALRTYYIF